MKAILVSISFLISLISLGQDDLYEKDDIMRLEIVMCEWDTTELILPTGWDSTDVFNYVEGFIKTYHYPDKSSVSILCGSNADLGVERNLTGNRKIIVNGHQITYNHVPEEKIEVFNQAFNRMKNE